MPITTTQAITDEQGNTYPFLALTLATSPRWQEMGVGASVAIRLTPYRVDETGAVHHLEQDIVLVLPDAVEAAQTDPVIAQAVSQIAQAAQAVVTAKGL